jgi:transcriptional regulator
MYIPEHYREADPAAMLALVRAHPFGTLVSQVQGRCEIVHVPFVLAEEEGLLRGHMALANPLAEAVRQGADATAVFVGAQSYISPRNYVDPGAHFPTWNYTIVHVNGALRELDRSATVRFLRTLIDVSEQAEPGPGALTLRSGPMNLFEGFLARIIAFELPMTRLEGAFKLSQNKGAEDLQQQINHLRQGTDTQQELAGHMSAVANAPRTKDAEDPVEY